MSFDRRDFLRFGALGSAGLLTRRLAAFGNSGRLPVGNTGRKLLCIFLRGGNDGVNTVVPYGDITYPTARPTIAIPTGQLLPIPGSTFAGLNPALMRLQPAMAQGQIAFLHAVGTDQPTRSHFVEMQKIETAQEAPASSLAEEGFVPRLIQQLYAPGVAPALTGVSIANLPQRMFLTTDRSRILTHMRSAAAYSFGTLPPYLRMKGMAPSAADPLGDALWGSCSFPVTGDEIDGLIKATGENMCATETIVKTQVADWLYGTPPGHDPVLYPTSQNEVQALGLAGNELAAMSSGQAWGFMQGLEEAMTLLQRTSTNVVGVDLGAFDTHQSQLPAHTRVLHMLGFGLGSLQADMVNNGLDDILVLVISEFGRTAFENASAGTDHGVGGVSMVMGTHVNPGVYNCARVATTAFGAAWRALTAPPLFPEYADAVQPQTHFQSVIAEICERHFGMSTPDVDIVIPGISGQTGRLYRRLGFL